MTEISREEKARKRTLPVIGAVLGVFICGSILVGILLLMLPKTNRPLDTVQVDGAEYVLTCRTSLDGPIDLELSKCEPGNEASCSVVEKDSDSGIPCDNYTLQMQNGLLSVETKSGYVLFTYQPK